MLDLRRVVQTLTQERDALMRQIGQIDSALGALSGRTRPTASSKVVRIDHGQRKLSKQARSRIAEAQRQRWAKVRAAKEVVAKPKKKKHWTQLPKNKARVQRRIRAMLRARRAA